MDPTVFEYLMPTEAQAGIMTHMRQVFRTCGEEVVQLVPEGPDRDTVIRKLREAAMWANVAITRLPDGSPRR